MREAEPTSPCTLRQNISSILFLSATLSGALPRQSTCLLALSSTHPRMRPRTSPFCASVHASVQQEGRGDGDGPKASAAYTPSRTPPVKMQPPRRAAALRKPAPLALYHPNKMALSNILGPPSDSPFSPLTPPSLASSPPTPALRPSRDVSMHLSPLPPPVIPSATPSSHPQLQTLQPSPPSIWLPDSRKLAAPCPSKSAATISKHLVPIAPPVLEPSHSLSRCSWPQVSLQNSSHHIDRASIVSQSNSDPSPVRFAATGPAPVPEPNLTGTSLSEPHVDSQSPEQGHRLGNVHPRTNFADCSHEAQACEQVPGNERTKQFYHPHESRLHPRQRSQRQAPHESQPRNLAMETRLSTAQRSERRDIHLDYCHNSSRPTSHGSSPEISERLSMQRCQTGGCLPKPPLHSRSVPQSIPHGQKMEDVFSLGRHIPGISAHRQARSPRSEPVPNEVANETARPRAHDSNFSRSSQRAPSGSQHIPEGAYQSLNLSARHGRGDVQKSSGSRLSGCGPIDLAQGIRPQRSYSPEQDSNHHHVGPMHHPVTYPAEHLLAQSRFRPDEHFEYGPQASLGLPAHPAPSSPSPHQNHAQQLSTWHGCAHEPKTKRPWTEREDAQLRDLTQRLGVGLWAAIAEHIPGRTGKQVRERWLNHLSPAVVKRPWSVDEDRIIINAHAQFGNSWSKICKLLNGRSENMCKNRFWTKLCKLTTTPRPPLKAEDRLKLGAQRPLSKR